MISLPNPKAYQMTNSELDTLKGNYCEMIIDGMDMDTLLTLAYDLLMDAYKESTEEDIKEEILDLYDEDTLKQLLP